MPLKISDVLRSVDEYKIIHPHYEKYSTYLRNAIKRGVDAVGRISTPEMIEAVRIHLSSQTRCTLVISEDSDDMKNRSFCVLEGNTEKWMCQLRCLCARGRIFSLPAYYKKLQDTVLHVGFELDPITVSKSCTVLEIDGNVYEVVSLLLGVEQHEFIEYQRLDRIINFIQNDPQARRYFSLLDRFLKHCRTLHWQERERLLVFSGAVFSALGTTYTRDVDLLYVAEHRHKQELQKVFEEFFRIHHDIEPTVLLSDLNWYTGVNGMRFEYKNRWLTLVLPQISGADNVFHCMSDPTHFFFFGGLKFLSIRLNIFRFSQRSSPDSLADLIMMHRLTNYPVRDILCLPTLTIRQGSPRIFYSHIDSIVNRVHMKIKKYYGEIVPKKRIRKYLPYCEIKEYDINRLDGKPIRDPITWRVEVALFEQENNIIARGSSAGRILQVGVSERRPFSDIVYSESSINRLYRSNRSNSTTTYSDPNSTWDVSKSPYRLVLFHLSLHRFWGEKARLRQNLIATEAPIVIVTFLDGDKVDTALQEQNGQFQIRDRQEPVFGLYRVAETAKVLVYMRKGHGITQGEVQPTVYTPDLVRFFKDMGYIDTKVYLYEGSITSFFKTISFERR